MSEAPVLHGLLVCRGLEAHPNGEVSIHNVVEILPLESLPGDAGPLHFVAFVRGLPAGTGEAAFLVARHGEETEAVGRLAISLEVPAAYVGRQVVLHVRLASLPVERGGWYEVGLEWGGEVLGTTRFAVGVRG